MKIKLKLSNLLFVGILSLILCSCDKQKVVLLDDSEFVISSISAGSNIWATDTNSSTFEKVKDIYEKHTVIRQYSIFGDVYDVYYQSSSKLLYPEVQVINDGQFVPNPKTLYYQSSGAFDEKTGKCVSFDKYVSNEEGYSPSNYESIVNPSSSEGEYIDYARSVLSKQLDISLDGYDVEIETKIEETARLKALNSSDRAEYLRIRNEMMEKHSECFNIDHYGGNIFDNIIDNEYYYVYYYFLFYKKIDGIRRYDRIHLQLSNYGEPFGYMYFSYDDVYKPYEKIDLDNEKIDKLLDERIEHNTPSTTTSVSIDKYLIPIDDTLYVYATVEYDYTNESGEKMSDGIKYRMPVARLSK